MTEDLFKTAYWEGELPKKFKESIQRVLIEGHLSNFKEYKDTWCLAMLCNELNLETNAEQIGVATIKRHLENTARQTGFRYARDKKMILDMFEVLSETDLNKKEIYSKIASKMPRYGTERIRRIIERNSTSDK